jgi:hypothetical protein
VDLYFHSPNTLSWCGAQLGGAQGQLYILLYFYDFGASHYGTPLTYRNRNERKEKLRRYSRRGDNFAGVAMAFVTGHSIR